MEEEGGKVDEKKKVMVAIDESECSHYALQWALDNLGHTISNSKLIIFSAQPIDDLGYTYASSFGAAHQIWTFQSILDNPDFAIRNRAVRIHCTGTRRQNYQHEPTKAPQLIRSIQENKKKLTLALLERAKEICAKQGIVAETLTEIGNPKDVICEAVEKLNIQLLVLGSHGRGALKRAFLGSVSNYCVRHAKCPVLVIRKKT